MQNLKQHVSGSTRIEVPGGKRTELQSMDVGTGGNMRNSK